MDAKKTVNIYFHVIILFIFLTIFFFVYLSKVQKQEVSKSITNNIPVQVDNMLSGFDYLDKKLAPYTYPNIKWDKVKEEGIKISKPDPNVTKDIEETNKNLKYTAISIISILVLGLIVLIAYYKFSGNDVGLNHVIAENIVIFSLVGIIEFLFFKYIVSKYIPVTPYIVSETIIDEISKRIELE